MPNHRKILLADDVNFFVTLEKSFLQREEIDILVARDGQQAFDMIRLHRPDLVLLDLHMPVMNGDECCRRVKKDPKLCNTPIIMVTTAGREQEQTRCRMAGCDDIMLKPINRRVFVETVQKFLKVAERIEPRVPLKMQVMFGRDELLSGYSVNLSSGGLFLETENPLAAEEALSLKFHLPNQDQPICCQGSVAWVNSPDSPCNPSLPPGMGIKFIDLDLENVHKIRTLLQTTDMEPD